MVHNFLNLIQKKNVFKLYYTAYYLASFYKKVKYIIKLVQQ